MKKVAEGIYERQKNKDGTTSYMLRVMKDDHQYNKTVRCTSLAQAKKEHARYQVEIEDQKISYGTIKWPDLCDLWVEEYAKKQHKLSTLEGETRTIEREIKKAWNRQVSKITRRDVQKWVNDLSGNVAPKTVRNYYGIIRTIFRWAAQKELISDSPCQYIDLPKKEHKEAVYLDNESVANILKVLPEEPLSLQALILIPLFGGLRKGEILGLQWKDVDIKTGTFHVRQNRIQHQMGSGSFVDTPKTKSSVRRGTFPTEVCIVLRKLKIEQDENRIALGSSYQNTDYVIVKKDGTPISPALTYNWIHNFRAKYDLPPFSLHSLRHTHASLMRYLGANIDEIQKKLGHSDKSTTEYIYTHMFESYERLDREMAHKMDSFIKSQ